MSSADDLARDRPRAERLGQLEAVVQFIVCPRVDAVELDDFNVHARVVVQLAEFLDLAERR